MNGHRHEIAHPAGVLQIAWCACGAETRGRGWREPQTWAGVEYRKAWRNRPVANA